ncbi:Ca2-binding protein [Aureococcus anophagefferens]|nr:Ca2-binding protein [Aureococcus anophagefferens]
MQKYCLAHSSSDPFVGPTVGGRRLSMARLGQQIVDEPIPLAGPPKPCRRRHFAEAERRLQDLSQSPQNRRGVRSIPAPYGTNPSPLESAEDARDRLRLKPPRAVEPMQRESAAVEARRVRKAVDGIARWQQPEPRRAKISPRRPEPDVTRFEDFWAALDRDHDGRVTLLELARAIADDREDCAPLVADTSAAPAGETSPVERDRRRRDGGAIAEWQQKLRKAINVACHGAGAGASLGLLRSIFRRFDASGDGVIQRDELRKGLSIAGVDFSQGAYDEVMAEMDIDHDGAVSLPEFAHAICGGMDFGDSEHAYYREQRRPPKSLDALRDDFVAVPVSVLADVFHALGRAGHGRAVPVDLLAAELGRKALVDVTAADLAALAPGGTLAMDALYAALFGDGEVGHRATPEPSPYWRDEDVPKVLVIGGTQFMGVHTVELLCKKGYAVTVLNRGVTPSPFGEDVTHIRLDRFAQPNLLMKVVREGGWEAVVDFVAFSADDVADVAAAALDSAWDPSPYYVYVSSDSVYMACERHRIDAARAAGRGLDESDAVREKSRAGIAACKKRDGYQYRYGSGKLAGEEELANWATRGLECTALRLPDVIGPRDNLGGFLDLANKVSRASVGCRVGGVADGAAHRASIAFAPDVALAIMLLIRGETKPPVLHVACAETPSFAELVELIVEARGLDRPPKLDPGRRA